MPNHEPSLRSLTDVRPLYFLPTEPLAEELLIPAFRRATSVDCMTGFFSSAALASLAPGLATYINTSSNPMRLIISPFLRPEDQAAIHDGVQSAESIAQQRLAELVVTEDLLQLHTLKCLSHLLGAGRIRIKIALMKNAIFHPKVWIFRSADAAIAAHGSSNATLAGLTRNIEQIAVAQSWLGPNDRYMTEKFTTQFQQLYENQDDQCLVVDVPQALRDQLLATYDPDTPPTEDDFRDLYRKAIRTTNVRYPRHAPSHRPERRGFAIPATLQYTHGAFKHQGEAVDAWCAAGHRGVLEMATGSGKTITAMICAHKLHVVSHPLLVVVAAPYIPLIEQWCDEIAAFNITPVNLSAVSGARARARELGTVKRRLRTKISDIEVLVVTHDTLCNDLFMTDIQTIGSRTLLIADEVHNLGRDSFVSNPPSFFDYRLGLSATPVRQYDDEGTAELFSFFGPVVFRYSLQDAIGSCLVEYDYYVHQVTLTDVELDAWYELTDNIKANSWRQENDPQAERRPRSCPPPWICGSSRGIPRLRASRPIDSMSVIVPISLLTCINDRRIVSSRNAGSTSAGVVRPSGPGTMRVISNPLRSRCRQESRTALCSMADVTMWRPWSACAATAPLIARLSDSVAPEVQTISRGSALMRSATWTRACSTASSASRPKLWNRDAGLPNTPSGPR